MKIFNLFGELVDAKPKVIKSKYQQLKNRLRYRESEKEGRNCKNCGNLIKTGRPKRYYYKCRLIGLSHSPATDVKLKYVCDEWIRKDSERNEQKNTGF